MSPKIPLYTRNSDLRFILSETEAAQMTFLTTIPGDAMRDNVRSEEIRK
jgi:hypothetical protein